MDRRLNAGRRPAFTTLTAIGYAFRALSVLLVALTLFSTSAWAQVTINQGDIVVVDPNAVNGQGAIIRIDPNTSAQSIVSQMGILQEPVGIVIESNGDLLVTDRVVGVIRVNPTTGAQTLLAPTSATLIDPFGIALGPAGLIYITDTGCVSHACTTPSGNAKVFSVNPVTGAVLLVSSGQLLGSPFGIEVEANGMLVVTDAGSAVSPFTGGGDPGAGGIIRINPATGIQTVVHVATAGVDGCPFGITVDPITGEIFNSIFDTVAFPPYGCSPGGLWKANPVTGANTAFSPQSQIPWRAPFGMKVDTNPGVSGTLLLVDEFYRAAYRVNTTTGAIITNFAPSPGNLVGPTDIDVYTSQNTPTPLTGADLSITKSDGVTSVTAGDGVTYTYTIVVSNAGPLPATSVSLTDTWPAGFTRTNTSAGCSPATGTGNFTCNLGTIAPSGSVTVTATYTVPATTTGSQTNTASVTSSTADPNTNNNSASDTNTVTITTDLSVTKSDGVTTVTAGDGVTRTYTITVTNAGPSQATGVSLSDTWPSGFTQGTITPSQGTCNSPSGGDFTCSLGTIASGGSATVTANYTVPATTAAGSKTNTVTVSSTTSDPASGNNTASDNTTVATSADLSVTKTDGLTTVVACCTTTHQYTIVVTNAGPSQATNVILSDTWPSGFHQGTITPSQGSCSSPSGGNFTCTLGNIAPNGTATVTVNYTVPITTPAGPQTNTVTVTSATSDPNSNNNSASDTTTVVADADLSVTKTDGVTAVTAGDGITYTYTITVSNAGPSQAAGVNIDDVWPAGFTRGTITPSQGTCTPGSGGNFNCSLGSVAPSSTATVTVSYTVPASTAPGNQTNTVCVTSSTNDPVSNNNLASDTNTVGAASANLSVSKTDGVTTVTAGDNITRTYIITVSNAGPSQAVGVSLSDTWPAGFTRGTITPSQGTCTPSGSNFTCALGNINSGANATVSVAYTVPSSTAAGNQTNTVSVTSSTSDPATGNNTASDTNYVNAAPPATSADLKLIKTDSADPVSPSSSFSYILAVSNLGPNTATSLTVTDTLPTGLTYVSASGTGWSCNYSSITRTVTCTKTSLTSGSSSSIAICVTAPSSTGTLNNSASVSSLTSDPNSANNTDSESTTVAVSATPAKWTGSGTINVSGGTATFGFTAQRSSTGSLSGQVQYHNNVNKYDFKSTSITSITVTGNKIVFSGTGQKRIGNGAWSGSLTFTVTAYDFEPDNNDRFKIQVSDGTTAGSDSSSIKCGEVEQVQ